jgi:hypothetical protein
MLELRRGYHARARPSLHHQTATRARVPSDLLPALPAWPDQAFPGRQPGVPSAIHLRVGSGWPAVLIVGERPSGGGSEARTATCRYQFEIGVSRERPSIPPSDGRQPGRAFRKDARVRPATPSVRVRATAIEVAANAFGMTSLGIRRRRCAGCLSADRGSGDGWSPLASRARGPTGAEVRQPIDRVMVDTQLRQIAFRDAGQPSMGPLPIYFVACHSY